MADPILDDHYRAQVILHSKSGLAEDVYVNNFIFQNNNDAVPGFNAEDMADSVTQALTDFYTTVTTGGGRIAAYLSSTILQPNATVKVYDLGQTPPRLPYVRTFPLGTMSTQTPLPQEVAACLSYYAGRPLPRRRGRIFLGPLAGNALDTEGSTGKVVVSLLFRQTMAQAADRLRSGNGQFVGWKILSQADQAVFPITGGWVDNAFDTQRRRGNKATTRDLWGEPPSAG